MMDIQQALRLQPGDSISFSGAGGKTTALFTLARKITAPVIATTTTHFSKDQLGFADRLIEVSNSTKFQDIENLLEPGINLLVGKEVEHGRFRGASDELLATIYKFTKQHGMNLLIEADGSRKHPLKAPAGHEPVIPPFIDIAAVVAGLSALGKPLAAHNVHRVEKFAELAGIKVGDEISSDALARVLNHEGGGLKGIPDSARRICILNQADSPQLLSQGKHLARLLLSKYQAVLITSFLDLINNGDQEGGSLDHTEGIYAVHEPVSAIVLAAGGSLRLGRPKQLLPWKGKSLIRHVVERVMMADLAQITIVLGSFHEEIRSELSGLPINIVMNPQWESGQSTSIQAGLSSIPETIGAVIFVLVDQPHVQTTLIRSMVERHATTLAPIIAPLVDGNRGNPVLFDRTTFKDFFSIRGDKGGRELFSRYPVTWLEWHDPSVLDDIDTESDYQRMLSE
jgi:molybdenum cofactor cytidylyltransferase